MNFSEIVKEELNIDTVNRTIEQVKTQMDLLQSQLKDQKESNERLRQNNQKLQQTLQQTQKASANDQNKDGIGTVKKLSKPKTNTITTKRVES